MQAILCRESLNPSVADDPSGATDCTTNGINKDLCKLPKHYKAVVIDF